MKILDLRCFVTRASSVRTTVGIALLKIFLLGCFVTRASDFDKNRIDQIRNYYTSEEKKTKKKNGYSKIREIPDFRII